MKRLLIMRHAKSSWDDPALADFDRPLNQRGIASAAFMGEMLGGRGMLPDEIVSSPAKRAVRTATLVNESGGLNAPIKLEERIYEASPQALNQVASEFSEERSCVMMIGHNPGFEGFITFLTGQHEPMPTAAVAVIELHIDIWGDVASGCGRVVEVFRPRDVMKTTAG